jgi:hypothetical protein
MLRNDTPIAATLGCSRAPIPGAFPYTPPRMKTASGRRKKTAPGYFIGMPSRPWPTIVPQGGIVPVLPLARARPTDRNFILGAALLTQDVVGSRAGSSPDQRLAVNAYGLNLALQIAFAAFSVFLLSLPRRCSHSGCDRFHS